MKILIVIALLLSLSGCYTSGTLDSVPIENGYYNYNGWYGWWEYNMGYNWYPYYHYTVPPLAVYPPRWRMPHPVYNAPRHENIRIIPPVRHEIFRPPPPQNRGTQPVHPPRKEKK